MNIFIAAGIGLFAFTIASGFMPTTEAAWYGGQHIYVPMLLGAGLGISIALVLIGISVRA